MEKLISHTYNITGMTCGGCASTVKNKLSTVSGVTSVKIDLAKKEAEITSSQEIDTKALQSALSHSSFTISDQ